MIAVTTMGNSPTLASVLRMRLEEQFGPEWEHWTKLFGELRASIKTVESESGRKLLVGRILDDPAVGARIASGDLVGARKEAERCISSSPA